MVTGEGSVVRESQLSSKDRSPTLPLNLTMAFDLTMMIEALMDYGERGRG
jgi:hypothetical protein